MPKDRAINPAHAAHKAAKASALKKSKTERHLRQNEKLARRNPERLARQIADLKALDASGALRPKDKQALEALERDLKSVERARKALGDAAPVFRSGFRKGDEEEGPEGPRGAGAGAGDRHTGKRRRDEQHAYGRGEGSETDEEVRRIPMPRDTPPPVPRRGNAGRRDGKDAQGGEAAKVPAPAQIVYSAEPALRNLMEESKRFVPVAVAQNINRKKGVAGKLLEPEELDRLEAAGYGDARRAADEAEKEAQFGMMNAEAEAKAVAVPALQPSGRADDGLEEEARRFEAELRRVEMEEVPDEEL